MLETQNNKGVLWLMLFGIKCLERNNRQKWSVAQQVWIPFRNLLVLANRCHLWAPERGVCLREKDDTGLIDI